MKPTVVLVHGAFAESVSWGGVIQRLLDDRYPVISDAAVELAGASHAIPVSEPVAVAEIVLDATRSIG